MHGEEAFFSPAKVGNLISVFSFSKPSFLDIWKFLVHILEAHHVHIQYDLTSMGDNKYPWLGHSWDHLSWETKGGLTFSSPVAKQAGLLPDFG